MKGQEKHKQFAVKCCARFLTRAKVVEALLEEFAKRPATTPMHKLEVYATAQSSLSV